MKPIETARSVLASLPRCTATARQTGEQCRLPGTGAGGKCRFHGGASNGRPPTHALNTKRYQLERDWIRLLLGVVHMQHGGTTKFFKPGRLTEWRIKELLKVKLNAKK